MKRVSRPLWPAVLLLLAALVVAGAEEPTQPVSPAASTPPADVLFTTNDVINSISVGVVNGVIDIAKGQQRLRLDVEWDLFPKPHHPLDEYGWDDDGKPNLSVVVDDPAADHTESLGHLLQHQALTQAAKDALERLREADIPVAGTPDPPAARLRRATAFRGVRMARPLPVGVRELRPAEIESNWVDWLLNNTSGATCILEVKAKDGQLLYPKGKVKRPTVKWHITQYRRPIGDGKYLCRYRIKAVLPVQRIYFHQESTQEVSIHVKFVWRMLGKTGPVRPFDVAAEVLSENPSPALPPDVANRVEKRDAPDDNFTALITYASGSALGDIVGTGIRSLFPHAPVITGALVGEDSVDEVVALNLPARGVGNDDLEFGMTMGVVPKDKSALYGGPYARYKALTLGGGLKLRESDGGSESSGAANGDGGMETQWVGMIGLDMTEVFGARKKSLEVDTSRLGGWTLAEEMWSTELGLVRVFTDPGQSFNAWDLFLLEKGEEQQSFAVPSPWDLAVGTWKVVMIDPGWTLVTAEGSIVEEREITVLPGGRVDLYVLPAGSVVVDSELEGVSWRVVLSGRQGVQPVTVAREGAATVRERLPTGTYKAKVYPSELKLVDDMGNAVQTVEVPQAAPDRDNAVHIHVRRKD